jgi:TolA-binding protein
MVIIMNEELIFNKIEISKVKPAETPEQIDKKSILIVCKGLTEKFVPLSVLERDHWTFKGKESRYDHKLPENNIKDLVGHVHEAYMENNILNYIIEIWGYREDLKQLQDDIKKGKMSISAGFKATKNKENEIIEIYGREVSITPTPRCTAEDGCGITTTLVMNSNNLSEKNMAEVNNAEAIVILKETLERENKDLRKKTGELDEVITGLNTKFAELNEQLSQKDSQIKSLTEEIKTLKDVKEELETLSLRKEYVEKLGITDADAVKKKLEWAKKFDPEDLTEMIKDLSDSNKRTEKVTKSNTTGRPVVKDDNNEGIEENALANASDMEVTASLYPDLKERLVKQSRKQIVYPPGMDIRDGDEIPVTKEF